MASKGRRPKHIPQRTCIGCRETHAKWDLIRIVRTPEGVFVDPSRKRPGRGAYLHARRSCWEQAFKRKAFGKALRTTLTPEDWARLRAFMETLPPEADEASALATATGEETQTLERRA